MRDATLALGGLLVWGTIVVIASLGSGLCGGGL